jgi:hypothetical protein
MDSLNFSNVYVRFFEDDVEETMQFHFTLNGFEYIHKSYRKLYSSIWEPYSIIHIYPKQECVFCKKVPWHYTHCPSFNTYVDEVYQKLLEHPSIRLELLFKKNTK